MDERLEKVRVLQVERNKLNKRLDEIDLEQCKLMADYYKSEDKNSR
jgi:tetrahydromethanopterin S-methyltransferase subunit G